ncbi:hypothetical protein ACWD33_14430 [Streptomyces xiamenensis]|uniref:hypothetical protein n=1 Tax=Streptomyces sp. NRRL F-2890 TaxID=1463845 RepID=UPI0004C553E0|nr:hypothetical protein [Streptomyces sp. NRRL F-2890]
MLALRLARGSRPLALARRLLLAVTAGGVGFLLLSGLGWASAHPGDGDQAALRLAWCVLPIAATVQLAVAVARADPAGRPRSGLDSAGLGPARLPMLAAVSTAVAALLGSALALLVFLHLRGDISGLPFDGAAAGLLAADRPLPLAAALTLLTIVPAAAAVASALALRGRTAPVRHSAPLPAPPTAPSATATGLVEEPVQVPTGLPWGAALTGAGIAFSGYAGFTERPPSDAEGALTLPGALSGLTPGVVAGWLLIATGVIVAAPSLTHLCGRMLAVGRPGALRLLAGRVLQSEAERLGHPLGALCVALAAALAALHLDGPRLFGPLSALGTGIVLVCALGTIAAAVHESRTARSAATTSLLRLGAPRSLIRRAAMLRLAALLLVFAPLSWLVFQTLVLPIRA